MGAEVAGYFKHPGAARAVLIVSLYWLLLLIVSVNESHPPLGDAVLPLLLLAGLPIVVVSANRFYVSANAGVRDLALHDDLTGLHNRRAFTGEAAVALHNAQPGHFSLILLDVDGLKQINDECGHQAGDELLIVAAQHLKSGPGHAYRIGGDEFAVLIDRAQGDSMTALLDALKPLHHHFGSCNHEHSFHLSYGVAANRPGESFEDLFSRADAQLRDFKQRLYESGQAPDRRQAEQQPSAHVLESAAPTGPSPISIFSKLSQPNPSPPAGDGNPQLS